MPKTIKRIGLAALAGAVLLSGCRAVTPVSVTQHTTGAQSAGTTTTTTTTTTFITQPSRVVSENTDEYGNAITDFDENSHFPLYGMIKSENIYLYGIDSAGGQGMVLFQEGQATYFDWPDLEKYWMPELAYADYNGDGNKELAISLGSGGGTDTSQMDLHILTIQKTVYDGGGYALSYTDHALFANDVNTWYGGKFTGRWLADGKSIAIDFDGKEYTTTNDLDINEAGTGAVQKMVYENIVEFHIDESGKITVRIGIGAVFERKPTPYLLGIINGSVVFDGNGFHLENVTFSV
ncbi:MAG: hypothetical protein FWF49_00170 [Oscillospiraceae bacterium]|nr:hypothetical protein [Oscillospiraceae bacterium]